MINKKISMIICIFLISLVCIIGVQALYCCEKNVDGAWCQNDLAENCDDTFRKVPTSCESNSYCRPGCCYDSVE